MPTSQPRSNIRAYVHWRNPCVFAGEEIECIITFKNIATLPEANNGFLTSPTGVNTRDARYAPSTAQTTASSRTRPAHTRNVSVASAQNGAMARGHRPALSLNLQRSSSRGGFAGGRGGSPLSPAARGHGRSLSIMSLGTESAADRRAPTTVAAVRKTSRGGHSRSASLQVGHRSALQSTQSMTVLPTRRHSPLFEATTPPAFSDGGDVSLPIRPAKRNTGFISAGNTPQLQQGSFVPAESIDDPIADFEFPPRKASLTPTTTPEKPRPTRNPSNMHSSRPFPPRPTESYSSTSGIVNPISRVLSDTSTNSGTPRSSMDFYSLSNHSDETLTSEAQSQAPGYENGLPPKPAKVSKKIANLGPARPETLMIGYARTTGSFTLDGSLVNNAPFEDIKRKTVQSDGGVVGVEKPKRSSGVFGAFGWSSIGESLGGLLGGSEMSTIAEMKASAGSKSIPLLSTPQSLLFVDVTLQPGESKSYTYRFPLPRGLPPTHKGRAMKIEYTLAIGVQRPDGHSVKYVNVPFRVLGSVSSRGEQLGHDLLSPYVLLQDAGRSQSVTITPGSSTMSIFAGGSPPAQNMDPKKGLESFLRYTERLLSSPTDANGILLSPSEPLSPVISRKSSIFEHSPASTKEAIDLALMNANIALQNGRDSPSEMQSANRFTIARSGQTIAVLTLLRPAFRLGENVTGVIDLTVSPQAQAAQSAIPAYSIYIELHSTEEVDPALAIRSEASIQRLTKRVHAVTRENTLFARRIGFSLAIPATATPTFETTGVSLSWTMKVEFTTFRPLRGPGAPDTDQGGDQLLEELSRDERGISLIAKERLAAETFEIALPVRVYGAFSIVDIDKEPEPLEV